MAEKNFNARFKQKHDIEANWAKATFAPLAGEFIVYDVDENNSTPRIKIGDGETQINDLPFVGSGEASGIKKIGFTSDCDYVATSSDGITAFQTAISEAADGDTILVMPGTYTSASILTIDKSINFIGIGKPVINFEISVNAPTFSMNDDGEWQIEGILNVYTENFSFSKAIKTLYEDSAPISGIHSSHFYAINCIFDGTNTIRLGDKGKAYDCIFTNSIFGGAGYIGYSGGNTYFYNCKLNNIAYTEYGYAEMNFNYYNCDITFANNSWEYPGGTFDNCNISATTEEYISIQTEYPGVSLNNCKIFGKNPFRASNENIVYNNTFVYPYTEEDDSGSLAGENSGPKTIGFTADCDYVATESDGLTAFQNAVADAADGDTILVMNGYYTSNSTLIIDKNINFIGVGRPIINFVINGVELSFWQDDDGYYIVDKGFNICFENLEFTKNIDAIRNDQNPTGRVISNHIYPINCVFNNCSVMLGLEAKSYSCIFNNIHFSEVGYIGIDSISGYFYNCKLNNVTYGYNAEINFEYYNCDIRFNTSQTENSPGGTFEDCNINASTEGHITIAYDYAYATLNNCKIFGVNPFASDSPNITYNNTFVFAGSIPGASGGSSSGSGDYVTRTEMEEYVNETIIGGEW